MEKDRERDNKKKRKSRENKDHHDKKKSHRQQNSFKNNTSKRHEFRQRHRLRIKDNKNIILDHNNNDNHHHLHPSSSLSSPSSSSSSSSLSATKLVDHVDSVFDFPWLKDENDMFKADGIDRYTTSLEELMIQQQMVVPPAYNSYIFYDQNVCLSNYKCCVDDYKLEGDRNNNEEELDRIEYCIWSSVLDQPLDTGIFNKLL